MSSTTITTFEAALILLEFSKVAVHHAKAKTPVENRRNSGSEAPFLLRNPSKPQPSSDRAIGLLCTQLHVVTKASHTCRVAKTPRKNCSPLRKQQRHMKHEARRIRSHSPSPSPSPPPKQPESQRPSLPFQIPLSMQAGSEEVSIKGFLDHLYNTSCPHATHRWTLCQQLMDRAKAEDKRAGMAREMGPVKRKCAAKKKYTEEREVHKMLVKDLAEKDEWRWRAENGQEQEMREHDNEE